MLLSVTKIAIISRIAASTGLDGLASDTAVMMDPTDPIFILVPLHGPT
jgi:hypothetical protein